MIDSERLHTTKFSSLLTEDSRTMTLKLHKAQKAENLPEPSDREEYIHQVADSFSELQDAVDSLNMTEIFLKSYSVSTAWKNHYDQHHYFRYHYEAWVLNAIKAYERLLILTNSVYWLEVPHKEVTYRSISGHQKLQGTKILNVLNKVHGALSELQSLKNSVFHRYSYTDEDLRLIAMYSLLARNSNHEEKDQFSTMAKVHMKHLYLPEKRQEIEKNNQQIMKIVDSVFNALEKPYIEHRNSLAS